MENKFLKYRDYLELKHDWDNVNCITIIDNIYKEYAGISLDASFHRMNLGKIFTKKWKYLYSLNTILKELDEHWIRISIKYPKEFDLLFFVKNTKKDIIPDHFGMYIDQNRFIHIIGESYCTISELNEEYRNQLQGIYRHAELV